jgi:ABC-type proline/glycine betaine transport system permease subunit
VQIATVGVRQASLLGTGGLGNPLVSTAEAAGSVITAVLAILVPVLAVAMIVLVLLTVRRRRARVRQPA